tara:strand:+ start:422 stop:640 length:219 start_codon:yes stop_codon:yes gene_type:complete
MSSPDIDNRTVNSAYWNYPPGDKPRNISAVIDNVNCDVPADDTNRDYQLILQKVADGELTIGANPIPGTPDS